MWLLVLAAAVAVAVTFAPWHHSGAARRNSYGVLRAAERLDVVDGRAADVLASAWPFLPLIAALAVLALAARRNRIAVALAVVAGALEVAAGVLVLRVGEAAGWGASAAVGAGSVMMAAGVLVGRAETGGDGIT